MEQEQIQKRSTCMYTAVSSIADNPKEIIVLLLFIILIINNYYNLLFNYY